MTKKGRARARARVRVRVAHSVGRRDLISVDTDYVLVKNGQLSQAVEALRRDGHEVSL